MTIKVFEVEEQISIAKCIKLCFMFKNFQWTVSAYLSIHFLGTYNGEVLIYGIESNYNKGFTGSQHLTTIFLVNKQLKSQVYHHALFWIQNNTRLFVILLRGCIRI